MDERPGVAGGAVEPALATAHGEFEQIQFTEEDGAGLFEAGDDGGVGGGDVVGCGARAVGGTDAFGGDDVFDGVGDAVEGAFVAAFGDFGFGLFGMGASAFRGDGEEGVDLFVVGGDLGETGVGEFDGGELAGLEEWPEFGGCFFG